MKFLKNFWQFFLQRSSNTPAEVSIPNSIYELKLQSIDDQEVDFSHFKGKILLITNTASKCGFTSQYQELEQIHNQYKEKNFSVLAFPSNDFLRQEPGSNKEIKEFCETKFQVSFPLFAKAAVRGKQMQLLYRFLTQKGKQSFGGQIKWNFEKFLIDRKGNVRARFGCTVKPQSKQLISKIEELLNDQVDSS